MDGSLYFGTGTHKQKKLTEVSTVLGYAAQQNADLFTGFCYTQQETITTPPTKQLYHIEQFSKSLYETNLLESTLEKQMAIENLFNRIHKPSLVFVLGDFLEEVDLSLLAQKHEVVAVIIRDREEESPKVLGEVTLKSPQDNTSMETYFGKRSIEKYLAKLEESEAKRSEHFSRYDIRSVKIYTDEEVVSKLITLFV
jgi:hypothetical protein